MKRGRVGQVIDQAKHAVKMDSKFMTKPLVGKKASDFMNKSPLFPWKGTVVAGWPGILTGPFAPIVIPILQVKRWGSAGAIHPFVRSIGKKKVRP